MIKHACAVCGSTSIAPALPYCSDACVEEANRRGLKSNTHDEGPFLPTYGVPEVLRSITPQMTNGEVRKLLHHRDADWTLAIAEWLGLGSGGNAPLVPEAVAGCLAGALNPIEAAKAKAERNEARQHHVRAQIEVYRLRTALEHVCAGHLPNRGSTPGWARAVLEGEDPDKRMKEPTP